MTALDVYLRMSEADDEAGVDRQLYDIEKMLEQRGDTVRQVFVDNDISATTGVRRPGFEELLKAESPGIAVWHIDRLIRVSRDLERVLELGVAVHSVRSGHIDLSNPAGRATARTITAWATYEGEQKSLRQQSSAQQRARSGKPWWPRRPFGLEKDGTLRLAEAAALGKTYEGLLAGRSLRALAAELNGAGLRTNRDSEWTAMTLRNLLLNPRNAGIRTYRGEEIGPAAWSSIVDEDVFRAAVRLLGAPERRVGGGGARQHLLTGVATCGKCGSGVKVAWRGKKGTDGAYKVYVCRRSQCVSHRLAWVDRYVGYAAAGRLGLPDAAAVWASNGGLDLTALRTERAVLRERLKAMAEDYALGLMTRDERNAGSAVARQQLGVVQGKIDQATAGSALAGLIGAPDTRAVWDSWDDDIDRQRSVIETLFALVELRPRGRGARQMTRADVLLEWRQAWKPQDPEEPLPAMAPAAEAGTP